MIIFKTVNDHIGFITEEATFTKAVSVLHRLIDQNEDWLNDFPKGKWTVDAFDDEICESKVVYSLTTAKIKKLQKDGLF